LTHRSSTNCAPNHHKTPSFFILGRFGRTNWRRDCTLLCQPSFFFYEGFYAKPSPNEKHFVQAGWQYERVLVYGFPSPYVASLFRRRTILCFAALSRRTMKWRLSEKQTGLVNSRRHLLTGHREYQSSLPRPFLPPKQFHFAKKICVWGRGDLLL
jgi:hypothetical protein